MRFPFARTLTAKLLLVTGTTVAALLLIFNLVLISETTGRVDELNKNQAGAEAKAIASDIATQIGSLAAAAKTMAGVIGHGHQENLLDRKGVIDILEANLEQHPLCFGSWLVEAPRAYDGRGDEIRDNKELATNKAGIFTPYWSKTGSGESHFNTFDVDYNADWFSEPAKTLKGSMSKPYVAQETEVPTAMSSISYPVISKGKLIAVSGVDISLSSLQVALSKLKPFGTGRVMLLDQNLQWLAGPSENSLMQPYDQAGLGEIKHALSTGELLNLLDQNDATGGRYTRLVYPFDLPDVNVSWVLLIDVPDATLNATVDAQTEIMVAGGILMLVALVAGISLAARRFVKKPLEALVGDVSRIFDGDYATPVSGQTNSDETGSVARALEGFRHQLAEGRRHQAETAAARSESEAERSRSEAERNEIARGQRAVVSALGNALCKLSDGDLSFRIEADFPDEYTALKTNYNSAAECLEQAVFAVNAAVVNISAGAGEISTGANDLSRRTERQAAQLEETAAALNEITEQVNLSAGNAREAAAAVERANEDAERSSRIVQETIAAMGGIESSSSQMSSIIGAIDEIAFQTNLLALNAGVEAARAGDAGKGFAVVAQEVRELAQRSANAAKEIKALIDRANTQVSQGVDLVDQTGRTLQSIVGQVQHFNGLTNMISTSASEQAVGLKEMNVAMHHLDQVTQQNAAMVEQTTAASMALNEEARNLKSLVSRFRVSSRSIPAQTIELAHRRRAR